jgi:hypothetical protein
MPQSCPASNLLQKGFNDDLDVVTCFKRVTQGTIEVDFVGVLSTVFDHRDVAVGRKFVHDAVDCTFTDADKFGDFAESNFGVFGDANENMGMVRKKGPRRDFV